MLIGAGGLVVLAAIGFAVFNALFTNNTAPSGTLTAIPIVVNTSLPGTPGTAANSGLAVYQIVTDQSQVSFSIYEELGGKPNTVVGATNQVAGQLALNAHDLSQTQVGVIQVDARGLATDSDRRNGALRNFILNTNQFEYITFMPKSVSGLTGAAQLGQPFTFQITGDLNIRDVTRSVTFDVTAQGATASQITGTAKATVNRGDFSLSIPSVPNVANVGEQVTLQINFVANAQA
jgi:polyisoprenoid-binding protein YceI